MDARATSDVVLVHDWLTGMRGGEKVLESFARLWPNAPLATLIHVPGTVSETIEHRRIITSLLNRLPGVASYYRYLFPWMPGAIQRMRLPESRVVLSSSHCVAKAIPLPPNAVHLCYCHTPMRYAWHMKDAYFGEQATQGRKVVGMKGRALELLLQQMRNWDRRTAANVHRFLANSRTTQQRIRDCYQRESTIVYPPVDTDFYQLGSQPRESFYLIVSACAPYKRLDLAIQACQKLKRPLVIIGTGQDAARLQSIAGPETTFLGWQSDAVIRDHLQRCRALLFPGLEDFGIVPVEAQACGAPVIAFGRGGATETVIPLGDASQPTGVWFESQTVESMIDAMQRFEQSESAFDPRALRSHAEQFSTQEFESQIRQIVTSAIERTGVRRANAA
ncbi:glycosyltransferase [Tuwongella immobilis]|uniref:Glycosyl transferase family 1 domain-containing protein n=1 Tax=Tuwongella immobilis TaxID=692036 RepID=A0A6C2YQG4_9BACT|nr:glycosyltransferase [Tuwongella immobilis]VIP03571.1 Putative Glycosyl transferase, group 1 OS=Candidatus Nitrospira defluvii GN=NIDE2987 PE=4 SV=1: Glycos_transf_1 [Tuwongella immobilis]VTS04510.1 Putative Glycosyl transferase, group 1 OS=Candidatus Nitrospira defluvii GN=NIDE2987 PE=4 SV=1: Glycos_transf_1 [Tuwongella immobilis]